MLRKAAVLLLCAALGLTMISCSSEKKEEKAKEDQKKAEEMANEEVAGAVTKTMDELSDKITLKDETTVVSIREQYDSLSEEQKALVPAESLEKLEQAEQRIKKLKVIRKKKAAERKANKEAATAVTKTLEALPDKVTLKDENAVAEARAKLNGLTDAQKELIDESSIGKLTRAEAEIKKLKEAEAEKEEKKAQKKTQKKNNNTAKKQEQPKTDNYAIAKKYIGKKASALTAKIGKPKKSKKNPNCATDGEEYVYYYDGFYVGVQSKDMDSPLLVIAVEKG